MIGTLILKPEIKSPEDIPYRSQKYRKVLEQARSLAELDVPVLVVGEGGTGKTNLARYIHSLSARRGRPSFEWPIVSDFEDLIEREAFGWTPNAAHPKGPRESTGVFRGFDGGTLLIDPVDIFPAKQQDLVARFMEDSLVRPVGSGRWFTADLRFLFVAPSSSLERSRATFRGIVPRLYQKLTPYVLRVPPIRQRREDIRPLFQFFLDRERRNSELNHLESPVVTEEAFAFLEKQLLPANGWHLCHVAAMLSLKAPGLEVTVELLNEVLRDSRFAFYAFG